LCPPIEDMSDDTAAPDDSEERTGPDVSENVRESLEEGRERLSEETDRAIESFDEGLVDLLSWVLDTETRARIYVYLREHPDSTSEEVAGGTGLYPSTVREALAELTEEEKVTRAKRESEGAGNNPYEYRAIPPSDLVGNVVTDIQDELNTVFNLDAVLGDDDDVDAEAEPIEITVDDGEGARASDEDATADADAADADAAGDDEDDDA
jgi:predicted transcriptional regulator